ncbi:hypothetical protein WMO64_06395 [Pseudoflavonifractor sp. CLA-AP-H29]|uniref:NACHT domain-containing protein n=1 Tax=Pseudoflavonifractor intestinihominis TaxID=3133171 RepID=A0ABV1E720_9FIRM
MPGTRDISWRERLVNGKKLADFQAGVAADLAKELARTEEKLRSASPARADALKRELNHCRKVLERLDRVGPEPRRHVTLWGLREALCTGGPPILGAGKPPAMDALMDWVFGGTVFDIQLLRGEKGLTKKSVQNKLSILQHGCYQYRETGKQEVCREYLDQLLEQYRKQPVLRLQQVRDRLDESCARDGFQLSGAAALQIDDLFQGVRREMGRPSVSWQAEGRERALRQLSLLFVLALLTEDCYPAADSPAAHWLAGEDGPRDRAVSPPPPRWDLSRSDGIFQWNMEEIADELIPDVTVEGQTFRTLPAGRGRPCSTPMEQILERWDTARLFLLCGEQDSAVSGAGKTTSLRLLCRYLPRLRPIFVPLSRVYTAYEMRNLQKENGRPRLLTWLELQGVLLPDREDLSGRLLILDGLDEITAPEGVQALCDDLVALCRLPSLRIIVSSKLPPEELAAWRLGLRGISNLWRGGVPCRIRTIGRAQRLDYLRRSGQAQTEDSEGLNTPFLLTLYGSTQRFLSDAHAPIFQSIRDRWLSPAVGSGQEALFYRYLCVQICRWCESCPGDDVRSELDAFFLLFALPAVAFRMLVHQVCDSYYVPSAADPVDGQRVEGLIRDSFLAFRQMLRHFPQYQHGGLEVLASQSGALTAEGLAAGQAAAVLHRSFDPDTLEWAYHFVNHAMGDSLAMLHMANLFYAAYQQNRTGHGTMEGPFWDCPAHYLHRPMLRRVYGFLCVLFGGEDVLRGILEHPDSTPCAGLSGYLLCTLAAEMCAALELPQQRAWLTRAAALRACLDPACSGRVGVEYIMLDLCEQSRELRLKGRFAQAAEAAREAIRVHRDHPEFKNSDGYHSLAKVYLEQVARLLNGQDPGEQPLSAVPPEERATADQVWTALHGLADRGGDWPEADPVLGRLLPQSRPVLPALLALADRARLRLDHYQARGWMGSETVHFLLEASYVAKLLSVYAAFHEGASGAALNMLGCFCENQQELLENSPDLAFFQQNPGLHSPIPREALADPRHALHAWQLYLRIYQIQRGLQPYPARRLSALLLMRQVRLGQGEEALPGPGPDPALNQAELDFLWESTARSCSGQGKGVQLCRIRFLNELLERQEPELYIQGAVRDRDALKQELERRYRGTWDICRCDARLEKEDGYAPDLFTIILLAEYAPVRPVPLRTEAFQSAIRTFYQQQIPTAARLEKALSAALRDPRNRRADHALLREALWTDLSRIRYTTGYFLGMDALRLHWLRLSRLTRVSPEFDGLFRGQGTEEWRQVVARLTGTEA